MTNAERQAKFRAKKAEMGMVTLTMLVPEHAIEDFRRAAALMALNPKLRLGPMTNTRSGRRVSLETRLCRASP